jgi:hypothetical protein
MLMRAKRTPATPIVILWQGEERSTLILYVVYETSPEQDEVIWVLQSSEQQDVPIWSHQTFDTQLIFDLITDKSKKAWGKS